MKTSRYFDYTRARPDRALIKDEWIEFVVKNPIQEEFQSDGRIRKWAKIKDVNKYLRVILLEDGKRFITHSLIDHFRGNQNEGKIFF